MALRVLMLRKRIDEKKKELETIRKGIEEFAVREADLEKSIEEAETEEEKAVVEQAIDEFEKDKEKAVEAEKTLSEEVDALENELAEKEAGAEEPAPVEERKDNAEQMEKRTVFEKMNTAERNAILENERVKSWLGEIRTAIKEKRAITNVGLTIPEVILPLLRENILNWSKLYSRVNVVYVAGEARQNILGTIPEAVWTECCANLNELTLGFNNWNVDCFKVGGFFALCNANIEDSDYNLASEVVSAIGQSIGKALDKAILYGRNTVQNGKMPLGVVTSLLQESQPADYPTTARAWVDLHSSHVVAVGTALAPLSGVDLFKAIIEASATVYTDYSRGNVLWLMNDKTYKKILAESVSINATGAIVAGVGGTMPIIGGDIEVLNFIPDDVVIFGYFDLYLLAERAGRNFASSEHVRFLADETVYKGTARYDGAPIIREAFAIATINGATASATDVTFPTDTANAGTGSI